MFAGAVGSFVGNPCDLALVRMQSDSTLPLAERRNYKHVFDAFGRIIKEEGVTACWNGATPTIARAIAMNVAMLVTYDECKERLTAVLGKDANPRMIQFGSSMMSAVVTSVVSLPFDNMKTKLQKMKRGPDGKFPYNGLLDCARKTVANEGMTGPWAGLPTYYFRVGPHAIITLMASEYLRTFMFAK